eukprot:1158231-Pelagomonas_calceolata.AAC.9
MAKVTCNRKAECTGEEGKEPACREAAPFDRCSGCPIVCSHGLVCFCMGWFVSPKTLTTLPTGGTHSHSCAMTGGVMMSCEQISFDITTGMAGQLGAAVVSAHSAFLNIIGLTFLTCHLAVHSAFSRKNSAARLQAGSSISMRLSLCVPDAREQVLTFKANPHYMLYCRCLAPLQWELLAASGLAEPALKCLINFNLSFKGPTNI